MLRLLLKTFDVCLHSIVLLGHVLQLTLMVSDVRVPKLNDN